MIELFMFVIMLLTVVAVLMVARGVWAIKRLGNSQESLAGKIDDLQRKVDGVFALLKTGPGGGDADGSRRPSPVPDSVAVPGTLEPEPEPKTIAKPPPLPTVAPAEKKEVVERPTKKREPSKLTASAREAIGKIWNWILVGEEHRPSGVTVEYAVASTWLLRLGILAILMCVAYFLKWSMDREILGPEARTGLSIMAGVGMLVFGMKLLGKKYHLIAQGLLGGGLATLYFSLYAAGPAFHNIVPTAWIFGLMILVTVASGVLAVRTGSLLVAVFGIIGGFGTPVMLSTGEPNLPVLYSYMLFLDIGILTIAYYKQWRLLNYLGFVCTYALFYVSLSSYRDGDFRLVMSFLSAFFVIQSSIVYLYNIARQKRSTTLEIIHLTANATVYALTAYFLIENAHGRPYPAVMSLGLAVFYIGHVMVFLKKRIVDRALLVTLIALAGVFTTWTLPLILEKESLTICLSLLAFMFLWIGRKLKSNFIRNLGQAVYLVVFFRLLVMDIPGNFRMRPRPDTPASLYWKQMAERLWTFGISIASIASAFLLQRKGREVDGSGIGEANNTPQLVKDRVARGVFYWFGVLFAFLFVHLEINTMFTYCEPLRLPVLTALWCAMALYFFWKYLSGAAENRIMFRVMCVFLFVAFLKIFCMDLASWRFVERMVYDMEYTVLTAGMRLIDFGAVLLAVLVVWAVLRTRERTPAAAFGYGGLILFFIYTSLELNSLLFWKCRGFQQSGISILWALFGITFISFGIGRNVKALRFMGLGLFLVVLGKVFLFDLSAMALIYRVVAFMVVGIALLLGSFAYIRSSRKFTKEAR